MTRQKSKILNLINDLAWVESPREWLVTLDLLSPSNHGDGERQHLRMLLWFSQGCPTDSLSKEPQNELE